MKIRSNALFRFMFFYDLPYFSLLAVAMIFGNKRILSFDNKFYNFLTNKNADCQYLLAHDFADDKFSLISQKDAILIKTQEMEVKIKSNGKIRATIARKNIFSLPVESKSGKCMRKQSIVICHFVEEKFKVVVDLKYFVTTVSMSGWHYGKSRGKFRSVISLIFLTCYFAHSFYSSLNSFCLIGCDFNFRSLGNQQP